jgi:hypothetical protein
MRSSTKFRLVLSFLINNKKIQDASLIGAANKQSGLGFLFKVYLRLEGSSQLIVAEVYIESYSNKISLKSYKNLDFADNFVMISLQESAVTKVLSFIKQKTQFTSFTAKSANIKDFLYGSLYKISIMTSNGNFDVYVYHDHST